MDNIENLTADIKKLFDKGIIKNRISQIKIHSLRHFDKESELNFGFPLTVIVGKNGSGKTTIMKAVKLLSTKRIPQDEFFETVIDDGGFKNADISYILDGKELQYKRLKQNEWGKEGEIPKDFCVKYIQTKTMVGAIDKSLLYDDIGKNPNRTKKVEYIIRQSKKLGQNSMSVSGRKNQHFLEKDSLDAINYILQTNIQSVNVINHKYYSGTWGTSIIFKDCNCYSEYNSGSGEFAVTSIVDKMQSIPSGAILLLDEPEVSLHPGAQTRLMCYILEVIKRKKIQVIITTHSTSIIENLPKSAIKCFRKMENGKVVVEENVFFQNAFLELEFNINKKHLIVEDVLAKKIIQRILKTEGLEELLQVDFYSGGASNIKKYTVSTYAKTNVENRYIFLDGDQRKEEIPDFSKIPEVDKTDVYFKELFKKVVGIGADKIDWGVNANRKADRYDKQQEKELILSYLEYYKKVVCFLPHEIPEDIIYDEEYLKTILGEENFPNVSKEKNAKEKLKKIADEVDQDINTIEEMLIYNFVRNCNDDYYYILEILKKIIEERS